MIRVLIFMLLVALVVLALSVLFQKNLYSRLSTRIAALIFASGPIALIIVTLLNELIRGVHIPLALRFAEVLLIVLGGPLILGLLAARFVRRPLKQFNEALSSLEQSNYTVKLRSSGIHEFNDAFDKFNEVTERLQREEKLRKDLVSDTSHELNTPLTTIIGQLTAMEEGKLPMTKERMHTLNQQAERLSELVQRLNAYTKARMPTGADESEDIAIRRACERITSQFDVPLKDEDVQVRLAIIEDLTVRGNGRAFEQILMNLVQNTLRYAGATEIVISADKHRLSFTDNGKGVPPEGLPHLFERFYRVEESRNRNTGGLGLGLAIVKELVEQQGWTIRTELAHPGLSFVITFR